MKTKKIELNDEEIKYLMDCMYESDELYCNIDGHLYARLEELLNSISNETQSS